MPNLAALRAAIFLLSAKNRWGGHICAPPGRARVKIWYWKTGEWHPLSSGSDLVSSSLTDNKCAWSRIWLINGCKRSHRGSTHFQKLPLTLAWSGGLMQPPWVFLNWTPHRLGYRAEIFHSWWGIFALFCKNMVSLGQVVSWSHSVVSGTTSDKISAKSWENAIWRGAIDFNGDSLCDWCQLLTLHHMSFKVN